MSKISKTLEFQSTKAKTLVGYVIVSALLTIPTTVLGADVQQVELASLSAHSCLEPFAIDGRLNEPDWERATVVNQFHLIPSSSTPALKTEVLVAKSEESLFFAFLCFDPVAEFIQTQAERHDGAVCSDDSVGIFVDPGLTGRYYSFCVNTSGVRAEGRYPGKELDWDCWWRVSAGKRKGYWLAEIEIPFAVFGTEEELGSQWGINLVRHVSRSEEYYSWAPVKETVHERDRWGRLVEMEVDLSEYAFDAEIGRISKPTVGANTLTFSADNRTNRKKRFRATVETTGPDGNVNYTYHDFKLPAWRSADQAMAVNLFLRGKHSVDLLIEDLSCGKIVFAALDNDIVVDFGDPEGVREESEQIK